MDFNVFAVEQTYLWIIFSVNFLKYPHISILSLFSGEGNGSIERLSNVMNAHLEVAKQVLSATGGQIM